MPLEQPGLVDLFKQLTTTGATTATDSKAIEAGFDPSSPDILKAISAQMTKMQSTGEAPDPETAKTLGVALKAHLEYNANMNLLKQLNKSYSAKYGSGTSK